MSKGSALRPLKSAIYLIVWADGERGYFVSSRPLSRSSPRGFRRFLSPSVLAADEPNHAAPTTDSVAE